MSGFHNPPRAYYHRPPRNSVITSHTLAELLKGRVSIDGDEIKEMARIAEPTSRICLAPCGKAVDARTEHANPNFCIEA